MEQEQKLWGLEYLIFKFYAKDFYYPVLYFRKQRAESIVLILSKRTPIYIASSATFVAFLALLSIMN
ncbi:hypothetical protein CW752_12155 [Chryseobacterium sp. PMSZPI]|nr:hypothetical protein CW752_12155 [Chryseobacterium sp. PMSZPI]